MAKHERKDNQPKTEPLSDFEKQLREAERAMDAADAAAGVDRKKITQAAQLDAAEAVAMVGIAMEADEEAAEAARFARIAERTGDNASAKTAREKERVARKKAKSDHKAATASAFKAYNAVRYSDPNSLGFLWVIQVVLGINILFTTVSLTTMIKGSYVYDLKFTLDLINVLFEGVTFWLILKRKAFTRPWVIGVSIFNIVIGTGFNLIVGDFNIVRQASLSMFDLFLLVYFLMSTRVKASLVEPFNTRTLNEDLDEDESFFRPKSWEFWRNLIIYFIIFSIVGHWMEAGFCLLIKYGIVPGIYDPESQIWSDWLYPFPVYGIGFCACAVLLYPLKNALQRKFSSPMWLPLALSFVANAFVCTVIEFVMGMAVNADLQLWDYSNMFGNFMGQVCLQNAILFGLVATLMTWVVYPALERLFRRVPNEYMTGVFVACVVGCAILYALYYITVPEQTVVDAVNTVTDLAMGSSSSSAA